MPYYYFEAATTDGHIRKRVLKARDRKDADRQLRNSGLRPMLIESVRTTKKKKQERVLNTQRIVRNTLVTVASISLVGGIAAYLIMLDLSSIGQVDVKALSRAGVVPDAKQIIYATSPEEREFAREALGAWEQSFPESLNTMHVVHKGLLMIYLKAGRKRFHKNDLRVMISAVGRAQQKRFSTHTCTVLVVQNDNTIAECKIRGDEVNAVVY